MMHGVAQQFDSSLLYRDRLARNQTLGTRPLSVAVLIDLEWTSTAGGHVKCWERLAEAATKLPGAIDLTIHAQGADERTYVLAPHVRVTTHRPLLSTAHFRFLRDAPAHTDVFPIHLPLLRQLLRCDVIHTTDAFFCYARTARLAALLSKRVALVNSVHTDTPGYTRIYARKAIQRLFGRAGLSNLLLNRWRLPERLAAGMTQRLAKHLDYCDGVLVPEGGAAGFDSDGPFGRPSGVLRRGIDKKVFSPERRNRQNLHARYAIPKDSFVLSFAGRVDTGKNVLTLVEAAESLIARGLPVHVLVAGQGPEAEPIKQRLGGRVTLTGAVSQWELGWLLASSDLFVFPSRVEITPNVVLEAKACGLPVMVAPEGGGVFVRASGLDGMVLDDTTAAAWAMQVEELYEAPALRASLGTAARSDVVKRRPSWADVFSNDLLPVWRMAALQRQSHSDPDVLRPNPSARPASR